MVIALGKSYKKSKDQSLAWPTPKLRIVIDDQLIEYVADSSASEA